MAKLKGATVIAAGRNPLKLQLAKEFGGADHVIDLGPDGGDNGGTLVAEGTPEEVSKVKRSYTGQYLAKILKK